MGSATKTPTENEAVQGTGTTRPNPVALETLVTVTGAQPSSEGARDLFTEETRTILVFVDGAVIQLASPVNEGQLLFLTNKKSNEEVVCQVLHKRKFGTTPCYVELQFTEDKPNYWGVAFPKGKKQAAEFTAAEHVAAEKTTEQGSATAAPLPNEKNVDDLKTQVDQLRKQLAEMEKKNAAEAAAKAVAERAAAEEHAAAEAALKEAEEAKASAARARGEWESANQASSEKSETPGAGEALLMPPAAAEARQAPGLTVKMALPTQSKEPDQKSLKEPEAEGLPRPELDFSNVPHTANSDEIAARGSLKRSSPWREKLRVVGFVVILAAVGFGAYEKLAPYVSTLAKKTSGATGAAKVAAQKPAVAKTPAAPAANAMPAAARNAASVPASANAPGSAAKPEAGKDPAGGNSASPVPSTDSLASAPEVTKTPEEAVAKKPSAKERSGRKAAAKESADESAPADVSPDAPVIPSKLLHAASPVYPPDAMRHYITGDVKAELVVEANGKVGDVKVLSGPSALRDAAIEALKKYEYAPATQGGKTVASKTIAVVKFWFNP